MPAIVIYSKDWCGYCQAAKQLLTRLGYQYEDIDVTHDVARYQEMRQRSNRSTVPQIFIDGVSVGGYTDLSALVRDQKLLPAAGVGNSD
jgi:glutaredoxin 3